MEKVALGKKSTEKKLIQPAMTRQPATPQGDSAPPPLLLRLQQTIGNQAVLRLFQSTGVQPKLSIGRSDDIYEQEADRVADTVMRMLAPLSEQAPQSSNRVGSSPVLRRCDCEGGGPCPTCEEEPQPQVRRQAEAGSESETEPEFLVPEEAESIDASTAPLLEAIRFEDEPIVLHEGCAACQQNEDEKRTLRRSGGPGGPIPDDAAPVVNQLLRKSTGQPLDGMVRSFMEPRFGADFSQVRVHEGAEAAASARELGAHAYTVGRHIVFGEGRFAPTTESGKRLLAHELTHVVQQTGAGQTRQEMIPSFVDGHRARPRELAPQRVVQRDKIEHRDLTWDDFKGKPSKGSQFDAATSSDFNPPDLKSIIPKKLEAEDTGEECILNKKKGTKGTIFRVDTGLDSGQIDVTSFMWQEMSWHRPWLTEPKARETKCKTEFVGPCESSFAKRLKKIESDCKASESQCKKAFKKGNIANYTVAIDGQDIEASDAQECTTVILDQCRALMAGDLSFDASMGGVTITANTKDECGKQFLQDCVGDLLDAGSAKVLEHEQGHFDITDTLAGQARDALRALVDGFDRQVTICAAGNSDKAQKAAKTQVIGKARSALEKELKALEKEFARWKKKLSDTQTNYDTQTKHGLVEKMQQDWLDRIAKGLP